MFFLGKGEGKQGLWREGPLVAETVDMFYLNLFIFSIIYSEVT